MKQTSSFVFDVRPEAKGFSCICVNYPGVITQGDNMAHAIAMMQEVTELVAMDLEPHKFHDYPATSKYKRHTVPLPVRT